MRRVKIVCTMGPATAGVPRLVELIEAGLDAARLNFSHGDHAGHRAMVEDLRLASRRAGKPISILADLSGPKIRVGKIQGGAVELVPEAEITLTTRPLLGTAKLVSHSYQPLARDVRPGSRILLDDGLLALEVLAIEGEDVRCRVKVGGTLKDKKGMNLPGTALSTPALTEKDKVDLAFARELGVDYLALSFVRNPEDLREAKELAGEIPVIAKIEKPEAIDRLDEILAIADGAMVARGDLGVELGHEKVPLVQKRILHHPAMRAKPTITATQMLDSMIHNPTPTRAEVSDVANAVLDGTDAVMLSGETSVGAYPVESVRTMASIIDEIEGSSFFSTSLRAVPDVSEHTHSNAIADAAADMAREHGLTAIAVYSESGRSAALVSGHRPSASVICFSRHERVLSRLALYWGVRPLHGDWVAGVAGVVKQAERELLRHELVKVGDGIIVTFGMVLDGEPFQTNMMRLWTVRGQADPEVTASAA
jgi:pyruvate kinase